MRALLSVTDKTDIVEFAQELLKLGYQLVSTGGTHSVLSSANLPVAQISEVTNFPEILDGRVKTLHPLIYGGILSRRDKPEHVASMRDYGIVAIDLICVNLYDFASVVARDDSDEEQILENIDIGGPTLIRAAAKNFKSVLPVVDPRDYGEIISKLRSGAISFDYRKGMARKAFELVSEYDSLIESYLAGNSTNATMFPEKLSIKYQKVDDLRYGENPHQAAALYEYVSKKTKEPAVIQLHGKPLSYNNILDADVAWNLVSEFKECTFAVVKHNNPCGVSSNKNPDKAYTQAYKGDPLSAFGGVVATNHIVSASVANAMAKIFYEIIIAPEFTPEALDILTQKKNLRILVRALGKLGSETGELRQISSGALLQTADNVEENIEDWQVATFRKPTKQEKKDLEFAWIVSKHVKSNAITVAKSGKILGIGAGQPSRVGSVDIALNKAGQLGKGAVMASDAFFPFADSIEKAAASGISAVAEPGGSIRDQEIIDRANELGLSVLFTGIRHFKH